VNQRLGLPRRKMKSQSREASRLAGPENFAPPQSHNNPAVSIMALQLTTCGSCQPPFALFHVRQ